MNIILNVQSEICDRLNAVLSSDCVFLPEQLLDIEYNIKKNLGRQGIVGLCHVPKLEYSGKYEDQSNVWQMTFELAVVENPTVNRGRQGARTALDVAMECQQILCPQFGSGEGTFNPQTVETGEDQGVLVTKFQFQALVKVAPDPVPPPPHISSDVKFSDGTALNPDWSGNLLYTDVQRALGTKIGLATDIFLGEDVTGVDDEAFSHMESLSSVTFGDSVAQLGGWILNGCPVQALVVPETVQTIAYGGLGGMDQIQTIAFLGRTEEQVSQMENFPFGVDNWQTVFQYGGE